ncbi:hypothetical protein FTV88_2989 [Heliorestis convoluta]|uniref:Uncharacterized protein n=2 Tax=Heliorestis convoluta TaxID=356322 RepID=A0A5Q2N245_9FIRM|nr:hypothetical protein FTV88_2989 [Heliorestis convoluta]
MAEALWWVHLLAVMGFIASALALWAMPKTEESSAASFDTEDRKDEQDASILDRTTEVAAVISPDNTEPTRPDIVPEPIVALNEMNGKEKVEMKVPETATAQASAIDEKAYDAQGTTDLSGTSYGPVEQAMIEEREITVNVPSAALTVEEKEWLLSACRRDDDSDVIEAESFEKKEDSGFAETAETNVEPAEVIVELEKVEDAEQEEKVELEKVEPERVLEPTEVEEPVEAVVPVEDSQSEPVESQENIMAVATTTETEATEQVEAIEERVAEVTETKEPEAKEPKSVKEATEVAVTEEVSRTAIEASPKVIPAAMTEDTLIALTKVLQDRTFLNTMRGIADDMIHQDRDAWEKAKEQAVQFTERVTNSGKVLQSLLDSYHDSLDAVVELSEKGIKIDKLYNQMVRMEDHLIPLITAFQELHALSKELNALIDKQRPIEEDKSS